MPDRITGLRCRGRDRGGFALPLARFDHDGGIVVAMQKSVARLDPPPRARA